MFRATIGAHQVIGLLRICIAHLHAHLHARLHAYLHAHLHARLRAHLRAHLHAHLHAHLRARMCCTHLQRPGQRRRCRRPARCR